MNTTEYEAWITELKAKLVTVTASIQTASLAGNTAAARMMQAQAASYQHQIDTLDAALTTMRIGKGRGT